MNSRMMPTVNHNDAIRADTERLSIHVAIPTASTTLTAIMTAVGAINRTAFHDGELAPPPPVLKLPA